MNSQLLEELSEECVCPLCLDLFDDPRILPCTHAFCTSCLHEMANIRNVQVLECPMCRKPFNANINNLPVHTQLKNIVEKIKAANIPEQLEQMEKNKQIQQNQQNQNLQNNQQIQQNNQQNQNIQNPSAPPLEEEEEDFVLVDPSSFQQQSYQPQQQQYPQHHPNMNPQPQQHYPNNQINQQVPIAYPNNQINQQIPIPYPNLNMPQQDNGIISGYSYNIPPNQVYNSNNNNNNNNLNNVNNPNSNINNNFNNNNLNEGEQVGYKIQTEDEVSKLKREIREKKGNKSFWSSFSSAFQGADLNFRNNCGDNECLLVPLCIQKEKVEGLVEEWLKSLWFRPSGLLEAAKVESASCITALFPFYLYEAQSSTNYRADLQITKKSGKNLQHTSVYTKKVNGCAHRSHKVLSPCAESQEHLRHLIEKQKISLHESQIVSKPFNQMLDNQVCFVPLSSSSVWDRYVEDIINSQAKQECISQAQRGTTEISHIDVYNSRPQIKDVRSQLVYFPLHVVQYTFNNQKFYVVVNGNTGEVTGDRSWGTGVIGETISKGWNFISNLFSSKKDNNNNNNNNNNN